MSSTIWFSWITVGLLLLAAMFFAVAETAFASVSRAALRAGQERGDRRAAKALRVAEHFEDAITTILIGTNIVHLAAASIVTVTVTRLFGVSAVAVSTVVTTLAVFFFGEMLPKSIARKYSLKFSLLTASPLLVLMAVLHPAASLLTAIGRRAASLSGGEQEASVTEEELYDIIDDMTEEGTLDEEQRDLISSALQFGDVTVRSVLTSRMDVAAIEAETPQEELLTFIKEQKHSRIPVYEETIDHIIGILPIRKYLKHYIRRGKDVRIRPLLEEPYFVHHSAKIGDLLPILYQEHKNLAVVTDSYGGTLGIVTTEDMLEELVGEIWDEDDRVMRNIVALPDGSWSVNAEEHVEDILDSLGITLPEEEENALRDKMMNELSYEHFTGIPSEGDSFRWHGLMITVSSMNQNRIVRLRIRREDASGTDRAAAPKEESPDTERSKDTPDNARAPKSTDAPKNGRAQESPEAEERKRGGYTS